jgi:hypothetical protein
LEDDPSCAIAIAIVERGNVLVADGMTVAETCVTDPGPNCVEDASDVARGILEYDCAIAPDAIAFVSILNDSSGDYDAIAKFACEMGGCYPALVSCQDDMTTCAESLSCDCANDFLSVVSDMSPAFSGMLNATKLGMMRAAACCDDFNGEAGNLMNQDYCSFQESVVREGSLFAASGNITRIRSSCSVRSACVGNVTETLARMNDVGCDIRQESDDAAKFLFYLNNSTDIGAIMNFVCDVSDECYDAVEAVVEICSRDPIGDGGCTKSAPKDCFRSFIAMVDSISDEGRDVLLGFDSSIVDKISNAPHLRFHASANVIVCIGIIFHMFS